MKKCGLLLGVFIMSVISAQAQEQYVEITVKDTLMVEPLEWYYYIRVIGTYEDQVTTVDTVEYTAPAKTKSSNNTKAIATLKTKIVTRWEKLEELKKVITSHGGAIVPQPSVKDYFDGLDKYALSRFSHLPKDDDYGLHIRFTRRDSLQHFLFAIRLIDDVEGGVSKISHPQWPSFHDVLDAKLVEAGRTKAGKLAQLAGRKLGPITQVIESSDATGYVLKELFERFVVLLGNRSTLSKQEKETITADQLRIEKTLKLRFAFL